VFCLVAPARESEGDRTNSVPLNGDWEFVLGAGDEDAQDAERGNALGWQRVALPGPFMPYKVWEAEAKDTRFVWARRQFSITPAQAVQLAVLRWNRIACGAAAFINGQFVGENEPTGPFQVLVSPGILHAGDNQLVLEVRGAAGVRRSRSGNALSGTMLLIEPDSKEYIERGRFEQLTAVSSRPRRTRLGHGRFIAKLDKRTLFGDDHRLVGECKFVRNEGERRLRVEARSPYRIVSAHPAPQPATDSAPGNNVDRALGNVASGSPEPVTIVVRSVAS
jgi:hypothetical protein